MIDKIQRLKDFELIQGEYLSLTLKCKRSKDLSIDVSSLTTTLNVYKYGNRDRAIVSVTGQKTDADKVSFKLSSANTAMLGNGKFEYIVTIAYSNGDNNVGLGYITIV